MKELQVLRDIHGTSRKFVAIEAFPLEAPWPAGPFIQQKGTMNFNGLHLWESKFGGYRTS